MPGTTTSGTTTSGTTTSGTTTTRDERLTTSSADGIRPAGLDLEAEFDRQLQTLLHKGYPQLADRMPDHFVALLEPLRSVLPQVPGRGYLPFLVVVRSELVPTVSAVSRFEVRGRSGWTDMDDELAGYRPIAEVEIPDVPAYLLTDVETGTDTLNVRPAQALPRLLQAGRSPLTIDEGVALVTQAPQVFAERNAFQTLASRTDTKRIPSFWVSKGAPRLGWCWNGNPHSWLGAASAAPLRLAAPVAAAG